MRKLGYIFLVLSATLLAGCLYHWENPYFVVKPSGLNWLNIRQTYMTGPLAGHRVHLRIEGSGSVVVREGTSSRVNDSFASNVRSGNFGDLREHRFTIPEEDVINLFQGLVNSGLFAKHTFAPENIATNETCSFYVSANIQNKTTNSSNPVTDPELLANLKTTMMAFYTPRPARKPNLN